jgi:hypothetical protein
MAGLIETTETPPAAPERAPGGWSLIRRRLLPQALVVLALLIVVDMIVAVGVEPLSLFDKSSKASTAIGRVALYHGFPTTPDVILMGNSRVQAGLDPSLLVHRAEDQFQQPVTVLNLGLVGGTPQPNYWLLKNIIQSNKQPKLIIYGATEFEFNPNSKVERWNYADELATLGDYGDIFPDMSRHIDMQLNFLVGRVWQLYRYRNALNILIPDTLYPDGSATSDAPVEDALGFIPINHVMNSIDVRKMRYTYLEDPGYVRSYTVQGYEADRFEQLLQLAQARGIRMIVINMPITRVHETFLPPGGYDSYRNYLKTITAKYGVEFVDYNNHDLWTEPDDFADTHHMNRVGAKKLSQLVSQQVVIPALRELGWK